MPEISRFYGISIMMHYGLREHPPAHFHAFSASGDASFDIAGNLIDGSLPRRELNLIKKWADLHQAELAENWNLCWRNENPLKIDPLP
jgi:hypothetical protein